MARLPSRCPCRVCGECSRNSLEIAWTCRRLLREEVDNTQAHGPCIHTCTTGGICPAVMVGLHARTACTAGAKRWLKHDHDHCFPPVVIQQAFDLLPAPPPQVCRDHEFVKVAFVANAHVREALRGLSLCSPACVDNNTTLPSIFCPQRRQPATGFLVGVGPKCENLHCRKLA